MKPATPANKPVRDTEPSGEVPPVPMTGAGMPVIPPLGEVATGKPLDGRAPGGRGGSTVTNRESSMKLTEFLDLTTLQDIQDSLAMVAQVKATILDNAGQALT